MKSVRKLHRISQLEEKVIKDKVQTIGEPNCWNVLGSQLNLPIRTIQEHYYDYVRANQDSFTEEEDKLILVLLDRGLSFNQMRPHFSNRTRVQLRNRYNKMQRDNLKLKPSFELSLDHNLFNFDEFAPLENFIIDSQFPNENSSETKEKY
jgi:hypothetical protein